MIHALHGSLSALGTGILCFMHVDLLCHGFISHPSYLNERVRGSLPLAVLFVLGAQIFGLQTYIGNYSPNDIAKKT